MVNQTHGRAASAMSNASDQNRKIFLGGLNYHTTDETLRKFCERFGKFTDCLVMRDADGKSRGFGFVTYEEEASVEEFMRARPHTIDNRVIDPKRAMPREDQNSMEAHLTVKKLFVAGLREGIDEQVLQDYFSRFGNVMEVLVMKQADGKPRGFAFVLFDDYDAVDKAILGKPHIINGRTLDIKKAIPKEKMQEMGYSGPPRNTYRQSGNGPTRNHYSSSGDDHYSNNWDGPPGMMRMENSNYNSQSMPPYPPSQGYNSNPSNYNPPSASGPYPASYSTSMGQSQAPPMMNYDSYNAPPTNNNNGNMPYSTAANPNSYPPPPPVPASYSSNPSANYGAMNNQYNPPPPPPPNPSGYKDGSSSSNLYGDPNDYGMMSQNYGGNNNFGNYNDLGLRGRGPGPMRGIRGGGGGYSGNNNSSNFGQRSAPYPTRGGRGGGRGRGRGQ